MAELLEAQLKFAEVHLDDWKKAVWTDETKIELVSHYVWRKPNKIFKEKNLVPMVKHGGESIMCGRVLLLRELANLHPQIIYQQILSENILSSVCALKLGRGWILQQENDQRVRKSTQSWLKKRSLQCWSGLVRALFLSMQGIKPSNIEDLRKFWVRDPSLGSNISPDW